ncbi:DedA family protein [Megalodesulfovibrio paquesii]
MTSMSFETFEYLLQNYGALVVLIGTFLEGETVLIVGGFLAHQGYFPLEHVMLAAFAGSVSGDTFFFFLGRYRGKLLLRRRQSLRSKARKVDRLIHKHKYPLLLGFRFLYGLRAVTPFVVGMMGSIPVRLYMICNLIGASVWAVAVAAGGYYFGQALEVLLVKIKHYEQWALLGLAVVAGGVYLWRRLRKKQQAPATAERTGEEGNLMAATHVPHDIAEEAAPPSLHDCPPGPSSGPVTPVTPVTPVEVAGVAEKGSDSGSSRPA